VKAGLYNYRAISKGGYDGDSAKADIDHGFGHWVCDKALRLHGIDTPEINGDTPIEKVLADAAKAELYKYIPEGTEFVLESQKDDSGKYGRILARIYVENGAGWMCLNDHLIKTKLAQPYFGKGDRTPWPDWYEEHKEALDPFLKEHE